MKMTRRQWLARIGFYGSPMAAFGYGSLVEKQWIDLNRVDVPLSPRHGHLDGMTVAVLGDFHHDDFGDDQLIERAVTAINDEGVDLIMLVGDYISNDVSAAEPLCHELRNLRSKFGCFGILGNHDCWNLDRNLLQYLEAAGIRLLVNESVEFDDFAVTGLDSIWGGSPSMAWAKREVPPEKPILLGWHEPDTFDNYQEDNIVLQMSGHTHGGQVCAPVYGPVLLPDYGKKYPYGLYRDDERALYVTRGIGTITIPTRFLCRPEVAILTLKA
tara:strand:- start:1910 stop:2722 length:813 start_codon:yes stop_codon:yes gene_type:complete